jgi:capsular polysaccharide biosynthesis protein
METEIRVKDLLTVLKRYSLIIVSVTMILAVAGGMHSWMSSVSLYQSSTTMLLSLNKPDLLSTLGVIIKDPTVLDKVIEELQLNKSAGALSGQISFGSVNGSDIVKITVTDPDPELAAQIANTTASVFKKEISSMFGIYNAPILSEAKSGNQLPVDKTGGAKLGFAVGLVLGIGLAILLDSLDDRFRSEREIEKMLKIPVLGSVSTINGKSNQLSKIIEVANKKGLVNWQLKLKVKD